ncbi:DUF4148 domain-containing protein [Roseateles sp.]|jgi:hypothetical protein
MNAKTLIASALIALSTAAVPAFAQSYSHLDPITPSQKSRAEVLADLAIYRESGLAAVDRTEDFALNAGQRAQAEARYAALKASPKYAELVQRFAAKDAKGAATEGVAAR